MNASAAGLSVVGAAARNGSRSTRSPATSIAMRARGAPQATRALPDRALFPSVSARSVTAASAAVTPTRPRASSRPASCAATPSAASSWPASSDVTWTAASKPRAVGRHVPVHCGARAGPPERALHGNRSAGRLEPGEGGGAQIESNRVARNRGGAARGRRVAQGQRAVEVRDTETRRRSALGAIGARDRPDAEPRDSGERRPVAGPRPARSRRSAPSSRARRRPARERAPGARP